jgi:hypothetical protein
MKTVAVVYLTHPLAFEYLGGQSLGERCIHTIQEVRTIDEIAVVIAGRNHEAAVKLSGLDVVVREMRDLKWDEEAKLTDQHCQDAFAYALSECPRVLVACVPYFPLLRAATVELCVKKLTRSVAWTGPCRTLPAVIHNSKGGMRRTDVAGYVGGVRVFRPDLRNGSKPWDNDFIGVDVDTDELLNVAMPVDRRLAEALLAG